MIKLETYNFKSYHIRLSSGDDEHPGCKLSLAFGHKFLTINLPQLFKPHKSWVDISKYAWSSSSNGGYWNIDQNEYGIHYYDGYMNISYGRQSNDSITTKSKGYFIPWLQYRMVRHSLYDPDGQHYYTMNSKNDFRGMKQYDTFYHIEKMVPKAIFKFYDYDNELIEATCHIEERQWERGIGWFKWLCYFMPNIVRRDLDISYNKEVGPKKGSWKGGVMGEGITTNIGESINSAFLRHCEKNNLKYIERIQ